MAKAKLPPVALPREANGTRVASQYLRSRRLTRDAHRAFRADPTNPGTRERRTDRTLACVALREKVRFLRVAARPLRGAARLGALRRAARTYRSALARWQAWYAGHVAI